MASPGHEQLLTVQDLDTRLDQLDHRIAHHELRGEIASVDADLAGLDAQIAEVEGRRGEQQSAIAALAADVGGIDARRAEIEGKLYDGSVTATKDLLALQDESAMLDERKRSIEDDELELMETVEGIEAELAPLTTRRAELIDRRETLSLDLTVAVAEIQTEREAVAGDRAASAGEVAAELLERYEALRSDHAGVAVARLTGGTCGGCHMALSAVDVDRIGKLADDAPVTCPECGRLLVR